MTKERLNEIVAKAFAVSHNAFDPDLKWDQLRLAAQIEALVVEEVEKTERTSRESQDG